MTEMISLLMNVDNESPYEECHTVGENNMGSPKNRKNRSNYPFLQYCYSILGLFCTLKRVTTLLS